MTRYTEYKDAGIGKIGLVPNHWEVERIGNLFQEISDRYDATTIDALPLLSVSEYYGVAKRSEKIAEDGILVRAESLDGYKICQPGDIVSNIMLTWKGALGSSPCEGIVSPAYCIYRAKRDINSRYYHYLFRTKAYTDVFHVHSTGLIDSRLRLYTPKFFALYAPVPTIGEQNAIVDYLDEAVFKIDALITEAKASIEEYKAWKASIIYEVVTKGLNPNAVMTDSNIEWIGKMPAHWKLIPFRYVLSERNEKNNPVVSTERLSLSIDLGVTLYADKTTNLDRLKEDFTQYKIAHDGDLVMNSMNMIVGASGVSAWFGCVSPAYYTFYDTEEDHVTAKFCEYIFRNKAMLRVLHSMGKGIYSIDRGDDRVNTCRLKVPKDELKSLLIPIPPIEEQRKIVDCLTDKCNAINALIAEKEELVTDLESYKKSLIFEVVTGKRKVV